MQTVLGVGDYMSPVEEALANKFLPELLGIQSISGKLIKLLNLGDKRPGLNIPDPTEVAHKIHQISQVCNKILVESLLTGEALSTAEHRACVRREVTGGG